MSKSMYRCILLLMRKGLWFLQRILDYIGKLSHEQMEKVDHAIHVSLGLYIPETVEAP